MKKVAGKIEELTRSGHFVKAFELANQNKNSKDKFIQKSISFLEISLFRKCMSLANNRATEQSKELLDLEKLLKKVKAINN